MSFQEHFQETDLEEKHMMNQIEITLSGIVTEENVVVKKTIEILKNCKKQHEISLSNQKI